jgi:hypothetical protein
MAHFGPPPRRRSKRLIIAVVAGVAMVVVGAVVAGVVIFSGGENKPGTAGTAPDAVKGYLEALARGDAAAALSYGRDQPATKQFLTDDILKKQIAKWPITNIRILSTNNVVGDTDTVHVAANFGDQSSDEEIEVKKVDHGAWKLEAGAIKLKFFRSSGGKALSTLTLFGEPFDGNKETYVFPGWMDFGNSNPNITQKPVTHPMLLNEINGLASASEAIMMDYAISDAGRAGIQGALKAALAECAKSTQLQPVNCPQRVRDSSLVDGTAQWTAPTDLSALTFGYFDAGAMTVDVRGDFDFQLTAKSTSGAPQSGRVIAYLYADADLAKNPPTITFK